MLGNLFEDLADIEAFVDSSGYTAGSAEWLRYSQGIEFLVQNSRDTSLHLARQRVLRLQKHRVARGSLTVRVTPGVLSSREALVVSAAVKRQLKWPCRLAKRRALAQNEGGRAEAEARELQRWRKVLAQMLKEMGMPICRHAMYVNNADRVLETAAGNTRASTLRQRIRECKRFSSWCMVLQAKPWTSDPGPLVDYLEELAAQPCARTKLKSVLAAVALLEKAGAVPDASRISVHPIVLRAVDTRTAELEQGAREVRRAAPLPLVLVLSLELMVLDSSAAAYWRAFAWVRHRAGRTICLGYCLWGGRWLPFFISRAAWLGNPEWLEAGLKIWKSDGFGFSRDYLVPRPSNNFTSCRPELASYADQATLNKGLLSKLHVPEYCNGRWQLSSDFLFEDPLWLTVFTEHSERNLLNTVAAASGVDRERRNYLGRWHVVESGDEYVVKAMSSEADELQHLALDMVDARLRENGVPQFMREKIREKWTLPAAWFSWRARCTGAPSGPASNLYRRCPSELTTQRGSMLLTSLLYWGSAA